MKEISVSQLSHPHEEKLNLFPKSIPLGINADLNNISPLSFDQIMEDKPAQVNHVIYPWLPEQGIAFVYAAAGAGKTLFSLNIAYAIAAGGNFLKYKAPYPKKILYVDGEMSYLQVHERISQIVKEQGHLEELSENFFLLTPDKCYPAKLPKICSSEGQLFYKNILQQYDIEVLVLDNLSMLSSIDENSSEQWKIIQDWLLELKSSGKSVIVVHHSGKAKNGYRGTSRMLDCADSAISLQVINDDSLESENSLDKRLKIEYQKTRSFGGRDAFPFEATLTPRGWKFQSMEQTNVHMVAERLNIGMRHHEIAKEMGGVSRPYISKLAKKARKLGLVDVDEK